MDKQAGSRQHFTLPGRRSLAVLGALIIVCGLVAFALSRFNLHDVSHALASVSPGWLVLALILMATSLFFRGISWHETLRAALPQERVGWGTVIRATMIGVLASAILPGRLGEPSRILVVARRLTGPTRRLVPIVTGTVFSQTLINLLALGILAVVTLATVPLLSGHTTGIILAFSIPLGLCALILVGPHLARYSATTRFPALAGLLEKIDHALTLARSGMVVFIRPRHGSIALSSQLFAWALQWLSCYTVLVALGLQNHNGLAAAATVLLAVNLSAVLPPTPSNVGLFQAACLLVLAAYGIGVVPALAYGLLLQAVEVITAVALGIPALLREGLTWQDIRSSRQLSSSDT